MIMMIFFLFEYSFSYIKARQGCLRKKSQRQYCVLLPTKNKVRIWKGICQADNLIQRENKVIRPKGYG